MCNYFLTEQDFNILGLAPYSLDSKNAMLIEMRMYVHNDRKKNTSFFLYPMT